MGKQYSKCLNTVAIQNNPQWRFKMATDWPLNVYIWQTSSVTPIFFSSEHSKNILWRREQILKNSTKPTFLYVLKYGSLELKKFDFVEFSKNRSIDHKLLIKFFDGKNSGVPELVCQINTLKEQFAAILKCYCSYDNTR